MKLPDSSRARVQRVRDDPMSLVRGIRRQLSPQFVYFDPLRDPNRAVVVLGSTRSGTTKLAEVLASARTTRLIFEPMQPRRSPYAPKTFAWGQYRDPNARDPELLQAWKAILAGNVRSQWVDSRNRSRLSTRRVVKCIAATNMAGWLGHNFPATPVVFIYRHPFAVALSIDNQYDRESAGSAGGGRQWLQDSVVRYIAGAGVLDGPLAHAKHEVIELIERANNNFQRSVLRWCMENYVPLTQPPGSGFHTVRYEDFIDQPEAEIRRIGQFTRLDVDRGIRTFDRSSSTDWTTPQRAGTGSRGDRRDGWRDHVPTPDREAGAATIRVFGLEHFVDQA